MMHGIIANTNAVATVQYGARHEFNQSALHRTTLPYNTRFDLADPLDWTHSLEIRFLPTCLQNSTAQHSSNDMLWHGTEQTDSDQCDAMSCHAMPSKPIRSATVLDSTRRLRTTPCAVLCSVLCYLRGYIHT